MSDTSSRALMNGRDLPAPLPPIRLEAEYRRDSQVHFWDYWTVLIRHRRTVAMVFVVFQRFFTQGANAGAEKG